MNNRERTGVGGVSNMFSDIKDGVLKGAITIETDVTIPEEVIEIGSGAFACFNSSCRSITIPDSVISIGSRAFLQCESLERITIPKNISKIGSNAFYSCYSLQYIKVADENTRFVMWTACCITLKKPSLYATRQVIAATAILSLTV